MLNLLMGLGVAVGASLILHFLGVSWWLWLPLSLAGGIAMFIWRARKTQNQLEAIFNRAGELMKKQQFDPAIEIMKEGYALAPWQFMVKGSIDGQIGVLQYVRKKNDEAEPLLRSASYQHYIAKAMLGILQWKRGEKKQARETFQLALKAGKKESLLYAVYAYVLNEMKDRTKAIEVLNKGLVICQGDERLLAQRTSLQNNKPMKMKLYGEQWYQFMLERPILRQEPPPFARVSKRSLRG